MSIADNEYEFLANAVGDAEEPTPTRRWSIQDLRRKYMAQALAGELPGQGTGGGGLVMPPGGFDDDVLAKSGDGLAFIRAISASSGNSIARRSSTGEITFSRVRLEAAPSNSNDAVTKSYVDSAVVNAILFQLQGVILGPDEAIPADLPEGSLIFREQA
jgi:hypothetical protein